MFRRKSKLFLFISLVLLAGILFSACNKNDSSSNKSSDYPKSTVTVVAPYAAGGAVDILSRALSDKLTVSFGQSVIVVNKPGGGGSIGVAETMASKADGYTITVPSNGGLIINPYAADVGYTHEDVTPIALLTEVAIGIGVSANSEFKSMEDLIAYAKANPGKIKYATPGANSTPHLLMEAIAEKEDITWNHVPNSSSPQAMAELLGGHIDVFTVNLPTFKPNYDAGSTRILATSGVERDTAMSDVPTIKEELGYELPLSVWFGVVGPKNMPEEVTKKISDAIKAVCEDPEYIETLTKVNFPPTFLDYKAFAEKIKDDNELFKPILTQMGIIK